MNIIHVLSVLFTLVTILTLIFWSQPAARARPGLSSHQDQQVTGLSDHWWLRPETMLPGVPTLTPSLPIITLWPGATYLTSLTLPSWRVVTIRLSSWGLRHALQTQHVSSLVSVHVYPRVLCRVIRSQTLRWPVAVAASSLWWGRSVSEVSPPDTEQCSQVTDPTLVSNSLRSPLQYPALNTLSRSDADQQSWDVSPTMFITHCLMSLL